MTDTVSEARANLREHQQQLDADGCRVGVSRQALDEVLDAFDAMLAASPQGEGDWITHDGGPNPVPGEMVEVRFKDGCTGEPLDSECYGWGWHPDPDTAPAYDIIAYRVTEGVKP